MAAGAVGRRCRPLQHPTGAALPWGRGCRRAAAGADRAACPARVAADHFRRGGRESVAARPFGHRRGAGYREPADHRRPGRGIPTPCANRARSDLRPRYRAAAAGSAVHRRRRRPPADVDHGPHRLRRMVTDDPARRVGDALRRPRRRRNLAAGGATHPVRRFRGLATGTAQRAAVGRAGRLVANPVGRTARATGTAHRPAAHRQGRRCRRNQSDRPAGRAGRRARTRRPRRTRLAPGRCAGRIRRPAVALHRPDRPGDRQPAREPEPRRTGRSDRLLRQHGGPAAGHLGQPHLSGTAAAGPRDDLGRAHAPGDSVRAGGRGGRIRLDWPAGSRCST